MSHMRHTLCVTSNQLHFARVLGFSHNEDTRSNIAVSLARIHSYTQNSAVAAKVPSHVTKCKSKKSATAKKLVAGIAEQPNIKPLIAQFEDRGGPIRSIKYCKTNAKGGRDKVVKIGNRLKKILRNIPAGIGMGEPPVAIAERPGKIPDKRGAIFSYAARDLRYQRNTAIAITRNAKAENWYTAAKDCQLSATSSGITPTWE